MDYEKLMLKIKNKYFPELKNVKVKPIGKFEMKILKMIHRFTPTMVTYIKSIHYNKRSVKKYNKKELSGIFAHELAHVLQMKRINWLQYIIFQVKYEISLNYKSKIEKEADRIAIKRGFGEGIILARKKREKTLSKKEFERVNKIYYSSKDLEKLVHRSK